MPAKKSSKKTSRRRKPCELSTTALKTKWFAVRSGASWDLYRQTSGGTRVLVKDSMPGTMPGSSIEFYRLMNESGSKYVGKTAGKKASKKTAKKASKKTAKKASKKRAKKASKKTAKKVAKKAASKKTAKKASKKTAKKVAKKRASKKTTKKASKKTAKKASKKTTKKASKKTTKKVAKKSASKKTAKKTAKKVAKKTAKKVAKKAASKKTAKKTAKKVAKKRSSRRATQTETLAEISASRIVSGARTRRGSEKIFGSAASMRLMDNGSLMGPEKLANIGEIVGTAKTHGMRTWLCQGTKLGGCGGGKRGGHVSGIIE